MVMYLDAGLVVYVALIVLGVWRLVCYWRCTGKWLQYANYCFLLLLTVCVVLGYDIWMFLSVSFSNVGKNSWDKFPVWLHPMIIAGPFFAGATVLIVCIQVFKHIQQIKDESAVRRHDRAVQIILLPAVYCTMAMSSLARVYHTVVKPGIEDQHLSKKELEELAVMRSETMFWVGDLYEAWALYQFGVLTMELIESSIAKQGLSDKEDERAAARALMVAHTAVERLAWVGILAFVCVAFIQAGYAIYLLSPMSSDEDKYENFQEAVSQLTAAGMLASGAALFNIMVVESTFHHYLEGYAPWMKFITVKIIVTFAFFQRGIFKVLTFLDGAMPEFVQNTVKNIPVLGTLVSFEPIQFEVFYASLILVEGFFVACLHMWSWHHTEEWYDEAELDRVEFERESQAILNGGSSLEQQYGSA